MRVVVDILIGFNLFMAGYVWGDDMKFATTKQEKISCLIDVIKWMLFGGLLLAAELIWMVIGNPVKWIDKSFQVRFFITFYFTKQFSNLNEEQLLAVNRAAEKKTRKTLHERMFKYCTNLVNKRHRYKYVHIEEEHPF